MASLICDHDGAKLKEEINSKSGTLYRCKTCGCLYRLILVANNKDCFAKRYPAKSQPIEKKKERKPKRIT